DPQLRADFNITAADELTTATSVNGSPARSKQSPNTNVQAMMAYELMVRGLSIGFFLETRQVRGFDTHRSRSDVRDLQGQEDQLANMDQHLWNPLITLVSKLKSTEYPGSGRALWDFTNIVICSEMGRTFSGNVDSILANSDPDPSKYGAIMAQDVSQH